MTDWSRRFWRTYEILPPLLKDEVATALGIWERWRRYGGFFRAHRLALEESQWWTPDEQILSIGERVRRFVHRAATTVPYYRDLFMEIEMAPDTVRDVEDLRRLPVLERETVRQEYNRFLPEAEDAAAALILRTEGPEQGALPVPISQDCFEREWAFRWQQLSWFGIKPGQRIATLADHPLVVTLGPEPPFWVTNRAESEMLLSYRRLSERTLPIYASKLRAWRPLVIHGPPSALHELALGLRDLGDTAIHPRVVVAEGETLGWEQRAAIELQFGCKVCYFYSNAEMVAHVVECEHGSLHLRPDHSLVELLNERGEPAEPGERARMVGTGYGNISFPLIRYRTGDAAVIAERPCVCNRGGLTLRSISLGAYRPAESTRAEEDLTETSIAHAA